MTFLANNYTNLSYRYNPYSPNFGADFSGFNQSAPAKKVNTVSVPQNSINKDDKNSYRNWLIGASLAAIGTAIYFMTKGKTKINPKPNTINSADDAAQTISSAGREIKSKPVVQNKTGTAPANKTKPVKRKQNNIDYEKELLSKGVKIQEIPRTFAPHSYQTQDIPQINITTRTPEIDFRNWSITKGTQSKGGGYQYREAFKFLKMSEVSDASRTVLVIGKNSKGEKTVWFQGMTGRTDASSRPVRTQYVLTVPNGKDFTPVQKDLIKGVFGRTQTELAKEMPLSRSAKVTNPGHGNFSSTPEDIEFSLDSLLREINHYSEGRKFTPELLSKLKSVDNLNNGEYIRLV